MTFSSQKLTLHSIPDFTTWSQSFPVGATGRGFKRADVKTKNSARKQRLFARSSLSSSSTDRSQTPANTTTGEGNAGLNSNTPHIGASAYKFHVNGKEKDASLLYTFDNDGAEVAEDEDDLYGCAPNEYLGISSIELDQKQHVAVRPRPPLPVTPPIWAQVRWLICQEDVCDMVPSLDRKYASLSIHLGAIKVASTIPMTSLKDTFLEATRPGQCIYLFITSFV